MKLGKAMRLRRRGEYLFVQARGKRIYSGDLVVLAIRKGSGPTRIGITVSKKVAKATGRNRVKRWVREAFREMAADLPPMDMVVIARSGAVAAGWAGARRALEAARRKTSYQ
jgi:ribonuclease P protein component